MADETQGGAPPATTPAADRPARAPRADKPDGDPEAGAIAGVSRLMQKLLPSERARVAAWVAAKYAAPAAADEPRQAGGGS